MQLRVYLTFVTLFWLGFSVSHAYWREARKKFVSKKITNWLNGSNTNLKIELLNWHLLKKSLASSSPSSKTGYVLFKKLTKPNNLLNSPLIKSSKYFIFSKPSSLNRNGLQTVRVNFPLLNGHLLPSQNYSVDQLHSYSWTSPSFYYHTSPDYLILSKFKSKYMHLPGSSLARNKNSPIVWSSSSLPDNHIIRPKAASKL